jgi:hypothetical protein
MSVHVLLGLTCLEVHYLVILLGMEAVYFAPESIDSNTLSHRYLEYWALIDVLLPAERMRGALQKACLLSNSGRWEAKLLKVPKREYFSITFFAQSEPIWICDVRTAKKIKFFYQLTPDFNGLWFFAAY